MAEFFVETQCWAHWPKVLVMGRNRNDGTVERRRYVPDRMCKFKPFKNQRSKLLSEGVCSECSSYMHSEMLYCPNCGAKVVDE